MDSKKAYWKLVKENKKVVILLSLLSSFCSVIDVAFAYISKLLIDSIGQSQFIYFAIALTLIVILVISLRFFLNRSYVKASYSLENRLKKETFLSSLNNDYLTLENKRGSDWLNILTSDCKVIANGVMTYLPNLLGLVSRILSAFLALLLIDWRFAIVIVVLGLLVYLLSKIIRKKSKEYHKEVQEEEGHVLGFYRDGLNNAFLLKLFHHQKKIEKECDKIQDKYYIAKKRYADFSIFISTGFSFFMKLCYLGAIIYASLQIKDGIGFGSLLAMTQLIAQIESPFSSLSGLLPKYYATLGSLERVDVLKALDDKKDYKTKEFNSDIEAKDISFSYPNGKVLFKNLSFSIKPNDFIYIQGASGCGKSTLLKIIMGMFKPKEGSILYEGKEIEESQGLFSYVPQGNFLLPTTIRENLSLFSEEEIKEERIHEVLKLVLLEDKIMSMPKGIDSTIADFGKGLSEGEGQRLSIARAILSSRPVLVLDECTSSLDENTEEIILKNIADLKKTIILVSHKQKGKEFANKKINLEENKHE